MKTFRWIAFLAATIALAGCVPELYVWSPDGQRMTVLAEDGLRLADARGNLQPSFIDGVNRAAWFPDSKRLLVARTVQEKTWDALAPQLSAEQIKSIEQAAGDVRDLAMNYDWSTPQNNTWDAFQKALMQQENSAGHDVSAFKNLDAAIAVYFRDHADVTVKQKIPALRWVELEDISQPVVFIQIVQVDSTGMKLGAALMHTTYGVNELRISPTGNSALVVTSSDHDSINELWAISTDSQRPQMLISDSAAEYPDWTPDGRDVVFVRAVDRDPASGETQLGSLTRVTIADQTGHLLEKPSNQQDLAGLIYSGLTRVRCLKDGRIVFATAQVTLPMTSGDSPGHPELFYLWPGKQATISRLLTTGPSDGDSAQYFEVSPDEMHVTIPDGTGQVSVIDIATGSVLNPPHQTPADFKLLTIPSWRSSDELTMIAPDPANHTKVVLWSISRNTEQTLSQTWPAGTVPVPQNNPATRPTTAPADSSGL